MLLRNQNPKSSMEDDHDGDGTNKSDSSSYLQRSVILRDWWLIKCSNEFEGKRFGVAGIEDAAFESRVMRVFTSSPIIKVFDVFTLQASDGIYITLQGFLNKERVVQSGFSLEISREFIFGFPPSWEKLCDDCFKGGGESCSGSGIKIDKGCSTILSPCENKKDNVEDGSGESEKNVVENNGKDGCGAGCIAGDKNTARRKSLRVRENCGEKRAEVVRKVGLSKVQDTTEDGDHGGEGKLEENQVQNRTHDGAHGNGGLDQGNENEVILPEAIENEVVLPEDGCGREHTVTDNVDNVTSTNATEESLISEQLKELKVTRPTLPSDSQKSSKPGRKGKKSLRSDGNLVEPNNHSGSKVGDTEKGMDASKVQNSTNERDQGSESLKKTSKNPIKESLTSEQPKGKSMTHSLVKGSDINSKAGKRGRPRKSEKTLKSNQKVMEPMNHTGSKGKEAKETLSWEKTRRKIDFDAEVSPEKKAKKQMAVFDFEVTPQKEAKKQETNAECSGSVGQRRSRSGRVLVSPLDFWRNQVPVYDKDRNIVQVKEGSETPFKGKGSDSRQPKKRKIK